LLSLYIAKKHSKNREKIIRITVLLGNDA